MSQKNKVINLMKLKDIDPIRAAHIHSIFGHPPKKSKGHRGVDWVETLIKHKMEKKNVIQNK
jgi:hypothetical protein|tara:strand:- start:628 stop:813 length:186 start_codon:yes stop_codon:yes gene_type:complete